MKVEKWKSGSCYFREVFKQEFQSTPTGRELGSAASPQLRPWVLVGPRPPAPGPRQPVTHQCPCRGSRRPVSCSSPVSAKRMENTRSLSSTSPRRPRIFPFPPLSSFKTRVIFGRVQMGTAESGGPCPLLPGVLLCGRAPRQPRRVATCTYSSLSFHRLCDPSRCAMFQHTGCPAAAILVPPALPPPRLPPASRPPVLLPWLLCPAGFLRGGSSTPASARCLLGVPLLLAHTCGDKQSLAEPPPPLWSPAEPRERG